MLDALRSHGPPADIGLEGVPELVGEARPRRAWTRSPAIDRLEPSGDARVARVASRHQALGLEEGHDAALAEATAVVAEAARPIFWNRRQTAAEHDRARAAAERAYAARPGDVLTMASRLGGRSRSDPAFATVALRVDPGHLVDDGPGMAGVVRVRCASLAVTRSVVASGWHPLPVAWRQHAADRALERGPRRPGFDVHLALGRELARLAPGIVVMADALRAVDPDAELAVPFEGGLLLGSLDVAQAGVATSAEIRAIGLRGHLTGTRAYDGSQTWRRFLEHRRTTTWTAMTYVGPAWMTPARLAYAERFAAATRGLDLRASGAAVRGAAMAVAADVVRNLGDDHRGHRLRGGPGDYDPASVGLDPDEVERARAERRRAVDAAYGFDAGVARALALEARATGVAGTRPHGREAIAAVPIRRRDHDDDPFRRAMRRLYDDARRRRGGGGAPA